MDGIHGQFIHEDQIQRIYAWYFALGHGGLADLYHHKQVVNIQQVGTISPTTFSMLTTLSPFHVIGLLTSRNLPGGPPLVSLREIPYIQVRALHHPSLAQIWFRNNLAVHGLPTLLSE